MRLSWYGHSAFGLMLPFIEGSAQYNALNYSQRATSVTNWTTYGSKVSTFSCPSDLDAPPFVQRPYSQSSYGMSRGTQENIYLNWATTSWPDPGAEQASKCNAALGNGMFGAENVVKIGGVTDGTSNTTLFGEMSRWPDDPSRGLNWWHFTAAFGMTNSSDPTLSIGGYFSSEVRPETGAFTYPDINAPPDKTGAIFNQVFCSCGSGYCIPSDWLDPKCYADGQATGSVGLPQPPPRRGQFRLRRRLGEVHQADNRHPNLYGPGYPGRWRGGERRPVLIDTLTDESAGPLTCRAGVCPVSTSACRSGRDSSSLLNGDSMHSRTKLALSVPLIASLVMGCSETPKPVVPTVTKAPTVGGADKGKTGKAKREAEGNESLTGPTDITE